MDERQQQELEERRRAEEECDCLNAAGWPCHTTLAGYPFIRLGCKRAALARYADSGARPYSYGTDGTAPDGRPLYLGTKTYEEYCKPHKDSL